MSETGQNSSEPMNSFELADFLDRLRFVSHQFAPEELKDAYNQVEVKFTEQFREGNVNAAYQLLCSRYELDGHRLDGSEWFSGDELGHSALGQCIEFAEYWDIVDPRLSGMREVHAELVLIAALESEL